MAKKRYELGLARNYVSEWSIQDALREFIQNGIDQESKIEDNAFSIDYNEETQTLYLCNKKSVLERNTLLLGCTSKKDDNETIGKFGEGYKVAALVLLREGHDVIIENFGKKEEWIFKFSKLKKYGNEESMVVDIDAKVWKKTPNNDLTVVIKNITPDEYSALNKRLLDKEAVYTKTPYGDILHEDKYKSMLFVNGLYVTKLNDNYKFGYNLKPQFIELGRDRNLVNDWMIKSIASKMACYISNFSTVADMLKEDAPDVAHLGNGSLSDDESKVKEQIAEELYESLEDEYGENVLIAKSESEKEYLSEKYGEKAIVATSATTDLVSRYSSRYNEHLKELEEAPKKELSLKANIGKWYKSNFMYFPDSYLDELYDILVNAGVDLQTPVKEKEEENSDIVA